MTRAFLSEWIKLRRRGMLLAALLITALAAGGVGLQIGAAAGDPSSDGGPLGTGDLTVQALAEADGFARALGLLSTLVGALALAIVAFAVASEFSQGTVRSLLVRQPNRVQLIVGKLAALATYLAAAVFAACLVSVAIGTLTARLSGVGTSFWFTAEGVAQTAEGIGQLVLSALGWGALGAVLGLTLRSPTTAIAAGLAYALPLENLLAAAWKDGEQWLPGELLDALAEGGTDNTSLARAFLFTALYATAGLTAAVAIFARRDVTV